MLSWRYQDSLIPLVFNVVGEQDLLQQVSRGKCSSFDMSIVISHRPGCSEFVIEDAFLSC